MYCSDAVCWFRTGTLLMGHSMFTSSHFSLCFYWRTLKIILLFLKLLPALSNAQNSNLISSPFLDHLPLEDYPSFFYQTHIGCASMVQWPLTCPVLFCSSEIAVPCLLQSPAPRHISLSNVRSWPVPHLSQAILEPLFQRFYFWPVLNYSSHCWSYLHCILHVIWQQHPQINTRNWILSFMMEIKQWLSHRRGNRTEKLRHQKYKLTPSELAAQLRTIIEGVPHPLWLTAVWG